MVKELEFIVLVDTDGRPIGATEKLVGHHAETSLHLAFSCYVFNDRDEFLVTQRAHGKKVWPGVWSNSVCGHPAPRPASHTSPPIGKANSSAGVLGPKPDFSLRSSLHRTDSTARSGSQEEVGLDAQARDSWEIEPMIEAIKRR